MASDSNEPADLGAGTAEFKKYIYAKGMHRIRRIGEVINDALEAHDRDETGSGGMLADVDETLNDLGCQLDEVCGWLWLAAFCDDERTATRYWAQELSTAETPVTETYSTGQPVTTTLRFGDGEHEYATYVWHPDPLHPDDQPGAVKNVSEGPYPFHFHNLTVRAPGIIEISNENEEDQ